MGQKVNPVGMRIGLNKNWNSRWFANDKEFSTYLIEDNKIRNYLEKTISKDALLSHVEIERKKKGNDKDVTHQITLFIFVGRAGVILGKDGTKSIKALRENIAKLLNDKKTDIRINLVDVKQPSLDATIVANKICRQLEDRASFRIVQKRAIQDVRKAGAKGVKTAVSGRLAGADIARTEGYKDGTMAINTLKSDIDYAHREAMTTYGKLGVKVWICRGDKEIKPRASKVSKANDNKGE